MYGPCTFLRDSAALRCVFWQDPAAVTPGSWLLIVFYNSIIRHLVLRVYQPKSSSVTLCLFFLYLLLLPLHPFPAGNHHTVICVYELLLLTFFLFNPFTFFTQSPVPLNSFQSVLCVCESVSILFVLFIRFPI